MKSFLITIILLCSITLSFGQNQNISTGSVFDGEPYIAINPYNSQHMVVAWMGYVPFNPNTKSGSVYLCRSIDGGKSWNAPVVAINADADPGKFPVDRPWLAIDRSGGLYDGNIYITTMPYS